MKVSILKFGGTSVGSSDNMRKVAAIVEKENAKITVLSAMSGTTDTLVKIATAASEGKETEEFVAFLTEKYNRCVTELLGNRRDEALEKVNEVMTLIRHEAANYDPAASEGKILSQGELLTTAIFNIFLNESGKNSVLIDILSHMRLDREGKVDTDFLRKSLQEEMARHPEDTVFITQGFICRDAEGVITNLGRGGSDYSASLIGAAIGGTDVQIWTDIDGMHNNDPRYVENTYPIRNISFSQAEELAYFGAKILHPAAIQPCRKLDIAVYLKNTMDPDAPGTLITNQEDNSKEIQAVAAKDGITLIRITSARMLMAYGFVRKVFEIFENHKTPVDLITTSEVAVTVTIDDPRHVDAIVSELQALGKIEVERNNTIICVVGRMSHESPGVIARVLDCITGIPVKMLSYGASDRSIAFLVASDRKVEVLRLLNDHLFQNH